jgi:cysteinyl-tRNA synthetase
VAYALDNGDVYFAVDKFKGYGKLSGKNIEDLQSGSRVDVDSNKRNPMDFALWKSAKPDEPYWDSPWGKGRPGWHIECSAMSRAHLGDRFDIHGGGMDLVFPHHENEVAQSEACVGHTHVNTWMHVGFVRVDDEKMSKSLNNFFTIREVLAQYPAEVIRMFLLSSHYRNPLNYTRENLDHAESALARLYTALRNVETGAEIVSQWVDKFNAKMDDDFNTPEALAVLFDLARSINRIKDEGGDAADLAYTLRHLGDILGILTRDAAEFLQAGNVDGAKIEALIAERNQARNDKHWARADEIRAELTAMGIAIEDGAGSTTWRKQ